jgi:formylglycine-generating enzyme required for sulfatase activity
VRGVSSQTLDLPNFTLIKGGDFVMGDHHGYVDPQHPSDELPLHTVHVDSMYMGTYHITNQQYCDYLNSAYTLGSIHVVNDVVKAIGDTNTYCYTNQYASYCSIGWNGSVFSVVDFRANHPMVGVMWYGAAAYCNWLSQQLGLPTCYNLNTWNCDFTKNGIRLPTEAEWEYCGRGGQYSPYYVFPWGNDSMNLSIANWPSSGDPYETGAYPYTTPIGFYNGQLRLKTDFNWPGSASSYQTTNGSNSYGLYDMAGNTWQFVNDWYGQNYYSVSPYRNPKGPDTGFIMPDGKPYRGMRGGNWYNGQWGHSRVANRNPSYYRGPQDPNHPWYHVGFRVARYVYSSSTSINEINEIPVGFVLFQNFPNPFNPSTTIKFQVSNAGLHPINFVKLCVFDIVGKEVEVLVNEKLNSGTYTVTWDASNYSSGIYFCKMITDNMVSTKKMILIR